MFIPVITRRLPACVIGLVIVAALCCATTARGMDTLEVKDGFSRANVQEFGYLYLEKKHEINFEKIAALPEEAFRPLRETGVSFSPEQHVHWVRFFIKNSGEETGSFILEVYNPRINRLQLFLEKQNGETEQSPLMGDDFPFYSRMIKHRNFLFPITVPTGETVCIYVVADKYSENMHLRMALHDEEYFEEADRTESFWLAFYTGFIFCICLLTTVGALYSRLPLLKYFLLYSWTLFLIVFGWLGYGFKYLWGAFPYFNSICGYLFIAISIISLMALTRVYLNTKENLPLGDTILKILQWIVALHIPYLLFYRNFVGSIGHIVTFSAQFVQFAYMAAVIGITVMVYLKTRVRDHIIFLAGFLFVLISGLMQVMQNIDLLDSSYLIEYAILYGLLLDIIVLTFLFGKQLRHTVLENMNLSAALNELKMKAARALVDGQQEERKRLSMELHDGMGLQLASIKMKLSKLKEKMTDKATENDLQDLLGNIGRVSADMRSFTHALSPVNFEETTLVEALEDLVFQVESANPGLDISLENGLEDGLLNGFAAQAIYQSISELLNNVIKHAGANQAQIELAAEKDQYRIKVKDNGTGFTQNDQSSGIGLKNLRARAILLNGRVEIASPNGGGAEVMLVFPREA